ncbi:hypothetical protein D3C76_1157490 [compost metagenome]
MSVFTRIAKEVKRCAITIVNVSAALNIHDEVVHQRVAVGQNIGFVQCTGIDLCARRQTSTFWRHTVDRILELALTGMTRLNHRCVVAGELDVTVVIGPFHLPGVNAVLAHGARIATRAQPVLHCVIDAVLRTVQTRRCGANLVHLLSKVTRIDRCANGIGLVD